MARRMDPHSSNKFRNNTIRALALTITPGDVRTVERGEVVPNNADRKAGLTPDFFRQFCAPGWLEPWREPLRAPKPGAAVAKPPAQPTAAVTVEPVTIDVTEKPSEPEKPAEPEKTAEPEASTSDEKFRSDVVVWAEANGIGDVAEYIDVAPIELLRQLEGKTPDEVRALLVPDDKEQDPSSDAPDEGDGEGEGSKDDEPEDVPDTHVLDPYGSKKQVHKKAFNQFIRKNYPAKDLNEARDLAGLPPTKTKS